MPRWRTALLALAFVGVAVAWPGDGGAVEVVGSQARLSWTPASGPVARYGVWITQDDLGFADAPDFFVSETEHVLVGVYGPSYVVRVAAFDLEGNRGPFSEASDPIVFLELSEPPPIVVEPPPVIEEPPPPVEEPPPPPLEEPPPPPIEEPPPPIEEPPPPPLEEPPPPPIEEPPPPIEEPPPPLEEPPPPPIEEPPPPIEEPPPPPLEEPPPPPIEEPPPPIEEPPPPPVEEPPAPPRAGAWDFDGDGRRDLLWYDRVSRNLVVWLMTGEGPREKVLIGSTGTASSFFSTDVDGDGRSDLILGNLAERDWWVWLLDGGLVTRTTSVALDPTPDVFWTLAAAADRDGDGLGELIVRMPIVSSVETAGPLSSDASGALFFPSTPLGTVTAPLDIPGGDTVPGDFDGDGRDDLAWQDGATRDVVLWLSGEDGGARTVSLGVPAQGLVLFGAGDFDADGRDDLLLSHLYAQDHRVWRMDASLRPVEMALLRSTPADDFWMVLTCGDFDGDGVADLLLRMPATGRNEIGRVGAPLSNGARALDTSVIEPLEGAGWDVPPR